MNLNRNYLRTSNSNNNGNKYLGALDSLLFSDVSDYLNRAANNSPDILFDNNQYSNESGVNENFSINEVENGLNWSTGLIINEHTEYMLFKNLEYLKNMSDKVKLCSLINSINDDDERINIPLKELFKMKNKLIGLQRLKIKLENAQKIDIINLEGDIKNETSEPECSLPNNEPVVLNLKIPNNVNSTTGSSNSNAGK